MLLEDLIKKGYLRTEFVRNAFLKVLRHDFVSKDLEGEAERDIALPIGLGKQIIKPQGAVFILENLDLQVGQAVLCLGSNSGWLPNLLAEIVGESGKVITLDEISKLTEMAQENSRAYELLKTGRIQFITSKEDEGFPSGAPYDRIVSLVSFPEIPEKLKKQLKIGGKMLILINKHYILIERKTFNHFLEDDEIQFKDLRKRTAESIYKK